jgi:hypothetical protein
VCSACGASGRRLGDGRFMCAGCGFRSSVTAGTLFDRSRTPLTVWFSACWTFATSKDGVSASSLQRQLGFGSYQTAWALLQRLRAVLVRPGRERLSGRVEVDETYLGGPTPGLTGRALGKRALVAIAVEVRDDEGIGRCRLASIPDASSKSLRAFVAEHVDPGTMLVTDGWPGYAGLGARGYGHEPRNQRAAKRAGEEPERPAAGGASGGVAGQALAARHPPGLGWRRAPRWLPQRVRVPLQPALVPQPRNAVLPAARAGRRPRPGSVRRDGQAATTEADAADAARHAREARKHSAGASSTPMAKAGRPLLQLDGDPNPHVPATVSRASGRQLLVAPHDATALASPHARCTRVASSASSARSSCDRAHRPSGPPTVSHEGSQTAAQLSRHPAPTPDPTTG